MIKRTALLIIFVSMVVIGAGYASAFREGGAPPFMTYAFAIATAAVMTAIIVLGAARKNRKLGGLAWVFAFTFVVLAIGFSLALGQTAVNAEKLYLGLPSGAAIILYVVGLLPMAVLPIAYALTFEKTTFDEQELEELRRKLAALKAESTEASAVEVLR
jgi:lysylphosphatidylglycerol synthetase-like protein (DUF2156 family)